jgi:hypothetical protein
MQGAAKTVLTGLIGVTIIQPFRVKTAIALKTQTFLVLRMTDWISSANWRFSYRVHDEERNYLLLA